MKINGMALNSILQGKTFPEKVDPEPALPMESDTGQGGCSQFFYCSNYLLEDGA
jgi:hypothetical protein